MKLLNALLLGITLSFGGAHVALADGTGSFIGASDHITTGGVTVTKNADGTSTITMASNFTFDGAPDPQIGFGKDGTFIPATTVGKLKSDTGAQSYIVPASINPDDFNEVYVFCVKFNVPLGIAKLN